MQKFKLIGLYSPFPNSGKSTVSDYLLNKYDFQLYKFSSPIKDIAIQNGMTNQEIEGDLKDIPSKKYSGETPREELDRISQEFFNNNGNDGLSKIMVDKLKVAELKNLKIVIDDVRFISNYELIQQFGGDTWKIEKPDINNISSYDTQKLEEMVFDKTIQNNQDIQALYKQIEKLINIDT